MEVDDYMYEEINNSQENGYYDYAISLGWFCGMASAMRWTGIRSFSSPFDWVFSDFAAVLKHIDDNFSDFLFKENMVIDEKIVKYLMIAYMAIVLCMMCQMILNTNGMLLNPNMIEE